MVSRVSPGQPVEAARERIVSAARRHFLAQGFRRVTMADLADELGISKKTLYAHFAGKTELLEAMLLTKFHDIDSELASISAECESDFVAGLRRSLACLQQHLAEIQPPFLRDIAREAPEIFQTLQKRRHQLIERHFGKLFHEGKREGLIRKDLPIPLLLEILLGTVQSIMNPAKLSELGLAPKAALTGILAIVLEGACTPDGRARR